MSIEIKLKPEIVKTIKQTGELFDTVVIDTEIPSTIGLFHIKIRHLDHFLEYFLHRRGITNIRDIVEDYASVKQLDDVNKQILQNYYSLFSDFNKTYKTMKDNYPNCESKMNNFVGSKRKRGQKFQRLAELYDNENYREGCLIIKNVSDKLVDMKTTNVSFFRVLDQDIIKGLSEIIINPAEIYIHKKRKDFAFCSDEYGLCYMITLKLGKVYPEESYLFTGFKVRHDLIRRDPKLKRIYQGAKAK